MFQYPLFNSVLFRLSWLKNKFQGFKFGNKGRQVITKGFHVEYSQSCEANEASFELIDFGI